MKKKVLHISAGGLGHGGVSTVIFSIVEVLHEQFDFSCVVFNRKLEREPLFEKYGKLYRINCYPPREKRDYLELLTRQLRLYFGVRRICKQEKFDVVHSHNLHDQWVCLLAAKHAGVCERVAHSHNTNSPAKRSIVKKVYNKIATAMLKRVSTKNIGCSKVACEHFFRHKDFAVFPNAIDLSKFSSQEKTSHNGMKFIHVGRFGYQKNQEFVIKTFAHVANVFLDAHLLLVGFGEERESEKLINLIQELGITDRVDLVPGDVVEVIDLYKQADYMIFPSRYEGFGIVLLEAQAMDIPCYVSENIQPEVDLGLLTFLSLADGPEKWAERIVADINQGTKRCCDQQRLFQYSEEVICRRYAELYTGKH